MHAEKIFQIYTLAGCHAFLGAIVSLCLISCVGGCDRRGNQVITAAAFHPTQCNVFMYSSSKGAVKLSDMRAAALCDTHSKGMGLTLRLVSCVSV